MLREKFLVQLTRITSDKFTAPLWQRAPASFTGGAKGPINFSHNAKDGVRMNSYWGGIEYSILKQNDIIYKNVYK